MVIHLVGGLPVMVRITFLVRIGWVIQSGTSNLARYCTPPYRKNPTFLVTQSGVSQVKRRLRFHGALRSGRGAERQRQISTTYGPKRHEHRAYFTVGVNIFPISVCQLILPMGHVYVKICR